MILKSIKLLRVLIILLVIPIYAQQGGMWVPSLLEGMNETEMKSLGMKMSISDIYDINNSSLKDATPHFNGGCTSEVISPNGLLLTNHHCGYGEIQSHSSIENDYLTNGFWAKSLKDELPNKNLDVTFMVKIEDVTSSILKDVLDSDSEIVKQQKIQKNRQSTINNFPKEAWQENKIASFYDGNQYILFVTETFKDVRLVGAPPTSIGKFGSDTDNWVWPRHTGDFSLFRIYADKNNRPAEYSENNVPYKPKHFFPISLDGIQEDDFTLVFGYPGQTQEYLPSYAVEQIVNDLNPAKIAIREASLNVTDEFMKSDANIKIQYASKYARLANYWKKWFGESQGLKKSNAIGIKQDFEKDFNKRVIKTNKQDQYGNLLPEMEILYKEIAPYALSRDYFMEIVLRNTELLNYGFKLYQLENAYKQRGEQSFNSRRDNLIKAQENYYKNYNKNVDEKVFETLIAHYSKNAPQEFLPQELKSLNAKKLTNSIYNKSKLTSYNGYKELLNGNAKEVIKKINKDKGYIFTKALADNYYNNIAPKYDELDLQIEALQRTYMKAQLELYPDARFFPDANGTLRVTYGKVNGYSPMDAVYYEPVTYLEGIMEKYVPNDYEFDVPQKLIELYNTKDYGNYAENGKMPVNFIGTNHTTGGNSGSPAIDAEGNLIGLNFDRVWEGTMSDIHYDASICRNIMVDVRYILFIIDKYAGAKHLIDEMQLVHPKRK